MERENCQINAQVPPAAMNINTVAAALVMIYSVFMCMH